MKSSVINEAMLNIICKVSGVQRIFLAILFYLWHFLPFLSDKTRTVPVIISCIRSIVTKSTNSLLVHLVFMVMDWQVTEELSGALVKWKVSECVLAKLPKEWNYIPLEARGKETKSKHRLGVTF